MEETVRLPMLSGATVSFSKPRKTELWGVIVPRQRLGWSHSPLKDGCPPRMDASANSFAGLPLGLLQFALCPVPLPDPGLLTVPGTACYVASAFESHAPGPRV